MTTRIGVACLGLAALLAAPTARAEVFSYSGVTFDQANAARTATLVGGMGVAFPSLFNPGAGYLGARSVGALLGGTSLAPSSAFAMDDGPDRAVIELTFGPGMGLPNGVGDDLAVFENGTPPAFPSGGSPDLYAVAVRIAGTSTFTPYYYRAQTLSGFQDPVNATRFDLGTYGLALGQAIDAVRIRNLSLTDVVTDPTGLSGFVNVAGASTALRTDPSMKWFGLAVTGMFDPDITYVAGLQNLVAVAVPEPASALLLGLGLLALGCARRRRTLTPVR